MVDKLKRGNLIFLKTVFADLFYIIREVKGEIIIAKKMDAPPLFYEELPIDRVVKIAEEQEKLFPVDLIAAIEDQRRLVLSPPKKSKKKKINLDKLMKGLPKEGLDEILSTLATFGITDEEGGG
jgi:hypothetical protein